MLPEYGRSAGIAKAERALQDLTDAADHLGIAPMVTRLLVSLWDAFHPGAPPPLVRHKAPVLDQPTPDPTRNQKRGPRCDLERIDSAEGQTVLQEVLLGLLTLREAARKLGVAPTTLGLAVRRRRREAVGDPAEIALTLPLKSH